MFGSQVLFLIRKTDDGKETITIAIKPKRVSNCQVQIVCFASSLNRRTFFKNPSSSKKRACDFETLFLPTIYAASIVSGTSNVVRRSDPKSLAVNCVVIDGPKMGI